MPVPGGGDAVVVCVGNPFRRDDGLAAEVGARLRGRVPADVTVVELDGEPARMVEAWSRAAVAVVVDASSSGARPGDVVHHEVGPSGLGVPTRPASSHGYAIGDAIALARAVDRLPGRIVVVAVEGEDFGHGQGLSDAVADAVPRAVDEVLAVLGPAVRPESR